MRHEILAITAAAAGWRVLYFTAAAMETPIETPLPDDELVLIAPIACFALVTDEDSESVVPVTPEDWPQFLYPQRSDNSNPLMVAMLGPGEELDDELRGLIRKEALAEQARREKAS